VGWWPHPLGLPLHTSFAKNRFDDPLAEFRTLYCSPGQLTCLLEVLADFRPALSEIKKFEETGEVSWNPVPLEWREKRALAPASVEVLSGKIVSLEDVGFRTKLERRLAPFLVEHGIEHLDLGVLQGANRLVTQTIARALFESGAAGVVYPSKLDNNACAALFEGRARLLASGEALPLTDPLLAFKKACKKFGL
jgi:RES domain